MMASTCPPFLQFLHDMAADPATPCYTGALPDHAALRERAVRSAFVFRYAPPKETPGEAVYADAASFVDATGAVSSDRAALCALLQQASAPSGGAWPARTPCGLPLCEASTTLLLTAAPGDGGRGEELELLIGSRYEIATTPFAVERFTVVAVPAERDCGGVALALGPHPPTHSASAEGAGEGWAAAEQELAQWAALSLLPQQQQQPFSVRALSFHQRQRARVVLCVCRVVSTAGGAVADASSAAQALRHRSAAALRRGAACDPLRVHFAAFANTAVPLLGVDAAVRREAWQRVLEGVGAAGGAGDALQHAAEDNGESGAGECEGRGRVRAPRAAAGPSPSPMRYDTLRECAAAGTSVASDDGPTSAEESRLRSGSGAGGGGVTTATTTSRSSAAALAGRRGVATGTAVPPSTGRNGSADTSFNSSSAATMRPTDADASSGSVRVLWGHAQNTSNSSDASGVLLQPQGPAAAAPGPVGVSPLPSAPARNGHSIHSSSSNGGRALDAEGEGEGEGEALAAQIYADSAHFLSGAAFAARRNHLHWQLQAMGSFFDTFPPYACGGRGDGGGGGAGAHGEAFRLTVGWQRWSASCRGGLSRPLIINSMDEIVVYCQGSQEGFFAAVALLDYFVLRTADSPAETCAAFLNFAAHAKCQQRHREAQHVPVGAVTEHDLCEFFTQVICVCCLIGCTVRDIYPVPLGKLLSCLNSGGDRPFGEAEFTLLEQFVLHHVLGLRGFNRIVTVRDVVDLLLTLVGGDELQLLTERNRHTRMLRHAAEASRAEAAGAAERVVAAEAGLRRDRENYLSRIFCATHSSSGGGERVVKKPRAGDEEDAWQRPQTAAAAAAAGGGGGGDGCCAPAVPPASSLTRDEVREWRRLSLLARLIAELGVRGPRRNDADVSRRLARSAGETAKAADVYFQCRPMEAHPCVLGVAIFAVTSEMLRVPLPRPLFAVLPAAYQRRLASSGLAPDSPPSPHSNEESQGAAPATGSSTNCFPVRPHDDAFLALTHFCALFARHTPRGVSDDSDVDDDDKGAAEAEAEEHELLSGQRSGGLSLARAIEQVQKLYGESRESACDKILQSRYKEMLSM